MERRDLAAAIRKASHVEGEFRLRSGAVAHRYFDKYQFEGDPRLLRAVAEALASLVPRDVQVLAGLELGGVPLATLLGQVTGLPVVFVRKAAKGPLRDRPRVWRPRGSGIGRHCAARALPDDGTGRRAADTIFLRSGRAAS